MYQQSASSWRRSIVYYDHSSLNSLVWFSVHCLVNSSPAWLLRTIIRTANNLEGCYRWSENYLSNELLQHGSTCDTKYKQTIPQLEHKMYFDNRLYIFSILLAIWWHQCRDGLPGPLVLNVCVQIGTKGGPKENTAVLILTTTEIFYGLK